jgi:uncharacterized membrane protein
MLFKSQSIYRKIVVLASILTMMLILFFIYENSAFNSYLSQKFESDMNIPINPNAPVKSKDFIQIAAPVDKVWMVLTEIDQWTSWQKNVTEAKLNGALEEGIQFDWKSGGLSFQSKIHTITPKQMFGWTGRTIGASAIHNWWFEENEMGTIVHVEESLQGVLPRIFTKFFQKNLDQGLKENLLELKTAAEMP